MKKKIIILWRKQWDNEYVIRKQKQVNIVQGIDISIWHT